MVEHDTILTALRFYQAPLPSVSHEFVQIAMHGGEHQALDADAIDHLGEAINRAHPGTHPPAPSVGC
jgi:hypothetical protein